MSTVAAMLVIVTLGVLAFSYKRLLSVRNLAVLVVLLNTVVGILLVEQREGFPIQQPSLYAAMVNKSVHMHLLGAGLFLLTLILCKLLGRRLGERRAWWTRIRMPSVVVHLDSYRPGSVLVLALVVLLGVAAILATFHYTGNVPFFNSDIPESKYFKGFEDKYRVMRPVYVAGQEVLAVSSFVLMVLCIVSFYRRDYRRAVGSIVLFALAQTVLVLTLKRGETFFAATMLLGGSVLTKRIRIRELAVAVLVLFCLAYWMRPPREPRPPTYVEPSSTLDKSPLTALATKALNKVKEFVVLTFCLEVKNSARLLYGFAVQEEHFFYGKTYVAGALFFVPSAVSSFREKYDIGRVTLKLFGRSGAPEGGPRIGGVGEAYINFGVWGVVGVAVLAALLIELLDGIQQRLLGPHEGSEGLFSAAVLFMVFMHFAMGLYWGGAGAIQTGARRTAVLVLIMILSGIFCRFRPTSSNRVRAMNGVGVPRDGL